MILDWDIALKRPKSGKEVKFKAGKKGIGTVKGAVADTGLDPKTEDVVVELALVKLGGTGTPAVVEWTEADKVGKVSKKGSVKFSSKRFGSDADLDPGDEFELRVRATEPDTEFSVKSTEILTETYEVK